MKTLLLGCIVFAGACFAGPESTTSLQCRALSGDLEALREVVENLDSKPVFGAGYWYSLLGRIGTDSDKLLVVDLLTTGEETSESWDEAQKCLSEVKDREKFKDKIERLAKRLRLIERANKAAAMGRSAFYREELGADRNIRQDPEGTGKE